MYGPGLVHLTSIWQTGWLDNQNHQLSTPSFSSEIISHAVWLYRRFCLSFREVEELLAEQGITVTYESVRRWCLKFGPAYARRLKKRQGILGDTWYLDEAVITIQGTQRYLWRAMDQDGDTIDMLVQRRRNRKAGVRGFASSQKAQRFLPLHGLTQILFPLGRHLMQAVNYRL